MTYLVELDAAKLALLNFTEACRMRSCLPQRGEVYPPDLSSSMR